MVLAAVLPGVSRADEPAASRAGRPNIVFVLVDDLGVEGLGCYGGTSYKTPHLDRLASEGMRFTHAYSNPICSPTRVALMTGQYNYRNYDGWGVFDPAKNVTFGHLLRDAGYATNLAGKWQFDNFQDHPDQIRDSGFSDYMAWTWFLDGRNTSRYWNPSLWSDGKLVPDTDGQYGPDLVNQFQLDFIREHKDGPFLLYYPLILVHSPFQAPPGDDGEAGGGGGSRPRRNFPAMVEYMDKMVGNLVAALDEAGVRDNTLIVFTGDNGTPRGIVSTMNGREVPGGKATMKQTGSHVAMIANWPGVIAPGSTCDDLVDVTDHFATLADLAGVAVPDALPIDGHSYAPQLRGGEGSPRSWGLVELWDQRFAFTQTHKLDQNGDLFDITDSPFSEPLVAPGEDTAESKAARELLGDALAAMPKAVKRPGDGPRSSERDER